MCIRDRDTIVWLDGQVLGKPKNREEAMQMLRDMSGRTQMCIRDRRRRGVVAYARIEPLRFV